MESKKSGDICSHRLLLFMSPQQSGETRTLNYLRSTAYRVVREILWRDLRLRFILRYFSRKIHQFSHQINNTTFLFPHHQPFDPSVQVFPCRLCSLLVHKKNQAISCFMLCYFSLYKHFWNVLGIWYKSFFQKI